MLVKIVGSGTPEINTELIDKYKTARLTRLKQGQDSVPTLAELPASLEEYTQGTIFFADSLDSNTTNYSTVNKLIVRTTSNKKLPPILESGHRSPPHRQKAKCEAIEKDCFSLVAVMRVSSMVKQQAGGVNMRTKRV